MSTRLKLIAYLVNFGEFFRITLAKMNFTMNNVFSLLHIKQTKHPHRLEAKNPESNNNLSVGVACLMFY